MADISSESVAKLRAKTGAGLMDCKRALTQTGGDFEKAVVVLREQGAASAAKRADRVTGDGLVTSYVDPSGKTAVLLELNCETDFVARTEDFQGFLGELTRLAATANPPWKSSAEAPADRIQEMAAKLKENIQLRKGRFARFDRVSPGIFSVYIHPSGNVGKVGVLVELGVAGDGAAALEKEEAKTLARDLAMQIAAASPKFVRKEDVSPDVIEQESNIAREQARRENKPEKIWDKIVNGKVQQYYGQFCLMEQPFVKPVDGGKNATVAQVVESVSKKVGATLIPRRFIRLKVGEED
ncbi:MAG: translation elongation factor Ts [Elusimicrobia bacterium]|nr:translation elongation factor Ts [Elusimicrobiota bacterium]